MKLIVCFVALALAQAATTTTRHGWLSDEECARGRASSGVYTGTNPECAKRCVAEGKKIVFIDPAARQVFGIVNQDAARDNIGDQVSIAASLDPQTNLLHIDSLKLISRGVASCSRPVPSKK